MDYRYTRVLAAWACFFCSLQAPTASAQVRVTTYHNDNFRTGLNFAETLLNPLNVNHIQFGKLFTQSVDGYVYAQPLYLPNVSIPGRGTHNAVFVATEHDSVYAFDADSNSGSNATPLWKVSFINPLAGITTVPNNDAACYDIVPEIGITGTPVIDASSGTLYVVAKTKENGSYVQRLHALSVSTGAEKFGGPVEIQASAPGTGLGGNGTTITFDPLLANQRPGLLLQSGVVYIGWAGHCDGGPYHGWLLAYNGGTLAQLGVFNSTPNGIRGGFWAAGAAPAADSFSNIFVATGNGTFDGAGDFADSMLKLKLGSSLQREDYFTPFNQGALNVLDADLGSGGILLLPDQPGAHPHLLVQAAKEGKIYLIDRDNMGGFNFAGDTQIVQSIPYSVGGMWSMAAYWNNALYFLGSGDVLRGFLLNNGLISTTPFAMGNTAFGFPGATASISAQGNANGIAWVLQTDQFGVKGRAILRAYNATNLVELYNSDQSSRRDSPGPAVKFTVPTVVNGKVYVGTETGLSVYGLR